MINVHDLAEVVRPICAAIYILVWPAGRRLPTRQHGRDRSEEVAPVKVHREALRLPVDVPAAGLSGTALDQFEQTVARADIPAASASRRIMGGRAPPTGIDDHSSARVSSDCGMDDLANGWGGRDQGTVFCRLATHKLTERPNTFSALLHPAISKKLDSNFNYIIVRRAAQNCATNLEIQ